MARLTNQDLHSEIKLVKNDIEYLKEGQAKMQADITMIKKVLLDPEGDDELEEEELELGGLIDDYNDGGIIDDEED